MPVVARRQVTFFASPKKVTKERRPEVRRPAKARGSLRYSKRQAAAELGLVVVSRKRCCAVLALRQSSRNAPVVSALLGDSHRDLGDLSPLSPRRRPGSKLTLFCLGPGLRRDDTCFIFGRRGTTGGPMRGAEQRNKRGGCPRGLSEGEHKRNRKYGTTTSPSSAAARVCEQRREPEGRRTWGRLFLDYFLLAKQKKVISRRATPGIGREKILRAPVCETWTPVCPGVMKH